jgi:putative hydrolase of the HAD superfamily
LPEVRPRPVALLIDFDGVLREFDQSVTRAVEERHGLPAGSLLGALLEPDLLRAATLGRITDEGWRAAVAGSIGSADAVAEWCGYRGEVRPEVLGFVREVRVAGRPVVLATNATDRLDEDLATLGLTGEFDAVVNSSVLGAGKPDPAFFAAACAGAGTRPDRCLLVDDQDRNVRGARAAGLLAYRYTGPDDLGYLRAALLR